MVRARSATSHSDGLIALGRKVLFVGAHADDIVLGCGGTIARYSTSCQIMCVTISKLTTFHSVTDLSSEHYQSMRALSVREDSAILLDFPARGLHLHEYEIGDALYPIVMDFAPDIVFTHAMNETHYDHAVVSRQVQRICRQSHLFLFEIARSTVAFTPSLLVELRRKDLASKIRALSAYETQAGKQYLSPRAVEAQAVVRGLRAGVGLAEGFETVSLYV